MKTPREILTERHCAAEPKLDAIRKAVVAEHVIAPQLENDRADDPALRVSLASKLWLELILPARRFWLVAAGAWVVIGGLNLLDGRGMELTVKHTPASAPEMVMAVKEQRQFMAQLLGPSVPAASPAKTERQGPRSDWRKPRPMA